MQTLHARRCGVTSLSTTHKTLVPQVPRGVLRPVSTLPAACQPLEQASSSRATCIAHVAQTASPPPSASLRQNRIDSVKMRLLSALASLDRGLAANGHDAREVDDMVQILEAAGGPVTLAWRQSSPGGGPSQLELIEGNWRLVYTSGFGTGSLGGRRPGPPAALVPSTLGQVYQRIDPKTMRLDNVVEFIFALPSIGNFLNSLPSAFSSSGDAGSQAPVEYVDQPAIRLTLKHDYEIKGSNIVEIVYEDTSAELIGSAMFAQLPKFDLPQLPEALKPPKNIRSATFEVVYLDDDMRITRGDRGELRVYMREIVHDAWNPED